MSPSVTLPMGSAPSWLPGPSGQAPPIPGSGSWHQLHVDVPLPSPAAEAEDQGEDFQTPGPVSADRFTPLSTDIPGPSHMAPAPHSLDMNMQGGLASESVALQLLRGSVAPERNRRATGSSLASFMLGPLSTERARCD